MPRVCRAIAAAFALLLTCALSTYVSAQTTRNNPYDVQLTAAIGQLARPLTAPETAVLLQRIYRLRDFVDDRAAIVRCLNHVAVDSQQHPLVRDEALRYLALIDIHNGQLDAARQKFATLGLVREWAVAGPFTAAQAEQSFTQITGWRAVPAGARDMVDLAEVMPQAGAAVAFAATSVYADQSRTVALRFSAESAVTVFVNSQQVLVDRGHDAGIGFDQHAVGVQLQAGWNSIVLKLARAGEGPWRFALRITNVDGGGVALRAAASQTPAGPSLSSAAGEPVGVADLVDLARSRADAAPGSATALEILGLLEAQHARGTALDHLEAAARRVPTATRWLQVAEHCGNATCTFAALNSALRLEPENPRVLLRLANYYVGRNQLEKARDLLQQAIQLEPADFVARNTLADVYASVGLNRPALRQAEQLQREFPAPLWLRRKLAARYFELGLLERAQAVITGALGEDFDDPQLRALAVRLYAAQRDVAGLRTTYSEMARLTPADFGTLSELAALDGKTIGPEHPVAASAGNRHAQATSGQSAAADSAYIADAAQLASAAQHSPPASNRSAGTLVRIRVERVLENGLSSAHVQEVSYISSEQGAREYRTRSVQYAPASQELHILNARVYKADGRVLEAEDAGENAVSAAAMYYDVRARALRFPALEPGDVVELEYRIAPATNVNPYGDYFGTLMVFQTSLPEQLQRYVLITPAQRQFNVVERRMPAAEVSMVGSDRVYRWEMRDTAPLLNEPRGPALTDVAPYVHVSTFQSWDDLGRWYAQLIAPQFALDATLRETATRLLHDKRTDLEKISAIHQFVLRNTHYVALEFGIYSYKPYPVAQTYARRFGDCKDKASLMIALLRQAGIDAELALVRTRRMGEVDPRATSIALFNHAIVYVPKYDLWLDGTAEYAGSRELPLEDQGAAALTVALDGRATLRHIPVTQPSDNYTRRTVRAQVGMDGRIHFEGVTYTRGENAPGLRRDYETPERQRDAVRNTLAEVFPSVHVDDVRVDGATDLEHPVTVEFRGTLDTFAGQRALPLASSWMPRSYVQTLAALASRQQDLLLPAPWVTEEELHFQLPPGAAVTLPADTVLETRFGSAALHYQRRGNEVVVRTSVQFRELRISPADYAAFRDFCHDVQRAFHAEMKVELRG